jgi:hypothetical protein
VPRKDEGEVDDRLEDAEREAFELREDRARTGSIARELDLRELLRQHRSADSALFTAIQKLPAMVDKHGFSAVRGYLRTHFLANVYTLGKESSRPARWRIEQVVRSNVELNWLTDEGPAGEVFRQWFASYVSEHFFFPATEALFKTLSTADEEPRST